MSNQETKKVLTVVDRSTKALNGAAATVAKVVADLAETAAIATALANDIEFKQSELEHLEANVVTKERELKAELQLRVKEDADKVLEKLLKERNLTSIPTGELEDLREEVESVKAQAAIAIDSAVSQQAEISKRDADLRIKQIESEHKVKIATLEANEKALNEKNQFLAAQVVQLQKEIVAERESRVEIAKADAQKQAVTVNTGK